jgi:hypothetical protein
MTKERTWAWRKRGWWCCCSVVAVLGAKPKRFEGNDRCGRRKGGKREKGEEGATERETHSFC